MAKELLSTLKSFYMVARPGLNELHSVHIDGCPFLPGENKRIFLGEFLSLSEAKDEGNKYFNNNCGCRFCTTGSGETDDKIAEKIDVKDMDLQNSALLKYLN